jgi:DNA invertase Pin-like site-specific DNA recombinase
MNVIAYYRRSTDNRQAHSFERQCSIVENFVNNNELVIAETFIETASGKDSSREALAAAIAYSRKHKTPICVSSISRLSRDVAFGAALLNDKTIQFIVCDLGMFADSFMLNVLLAVAQKEADLTSQRTKDALKVVAKYKRLGNPRWNEKQCLPAAWEANKQKGLATTSRYLELINTIRAQGITSYQGIAKQMNALGVKSPRNRKVSAALVRSVILRAQE